MTVAAISVRGLKKQFAASRPWKETLVHPFRRQWVAALDGVDLDIQPGKILGLAGPNGAGKTTLLKILCTHLLPTAGSALINGHDVVHASREARRALGYSLEAERSFYYRLTGRQNLEFFAALNGLGPAQETLRIGTVLDLLGLAGVADQLFMTYSRGTRQKLALARALLTDPAVLLLDEPTASLDPLAARDFRRLVRTTLARDLGKAILLVTHSLEEIDECCDQAALMEQGKISFLGSGAEVRTLIQSRGGP